MEGKRERKPGRDGGKTGGTGGGTAGDKDGEEEGGKKRQLRLLTLPTHFVVFDGGSVGTHRLPVPSWSISMSFHPTQVHIPTIHSSNHPSHPNHPPHSNCSLHSTCVFCVEFSRSFHPIQVSIPTIHLSTHPNHPDHPSHSNPLIFIYILRSLDNLTLPSTSTIHLSDLPPTTIHIITDHQY
ncbi:hypothetical protein E2C01_086679 [Portunus trituberculatus]|uniref:Uncharacterized protein n=1 Tax=Portunus trituberculatus TaxID=210409 RepID=A0A5B7J9Z3_PORTR|nr:hypothetical protein [Portunus trituberculatus]